MNVQRHHLSHDDMFRAIGIIENGGTQADAARVLNTGKGVISRMWSRYREFGSPAERHPGKSRVTTAAQDRFLHLRALRDRTSTANMLRSALQNVENVTVTTQTVRNRLHERGLNARRPLRCPAIRYGNRAPRVLWCRQHEDWTDNNQWGQVLFTDESRFSLRPDSRRLRIWRQPGAAERLRYELDAIADPQPKVLNFASIILPFSSTLICSFITSPQAGAPTKPVPTCVSFLSREPTFLGFS
ncbi:hypothetical protein C0J52_07828 [Blattella germanica]|nr:hypothetical protein C0J52_07828 [Blattella germanica]